MKLGPTSPIFPAIPSRLELGLVVPAVDEERTGSSARATWWGMARSPTGSSRSFRSG